MARISQIIHLDRFDRVPRESAGRAFYDLQRISHHGEAEVVDVRGIRGAEEPTRAKRRTAGWSAHRRWWTRTHLGECPVCGRSQIRKERVQNEPPPPTHDERIVTMSDQEAYCGCEET